MSLVQSIVHSLLLVLSNSTMNLYLRYPVGLKQIQVNLLVLQTWRLAEQDPPRVPPLYSTAEREGQVAEGECDQLNTCTEQQLI